jgi:hypothetical protein
MDTNPQTETTEKKTFARFLPPIARVLMGLAFFAFGIMGILMALKVLKVPDNSTEDIKAINAALMKAGYMNVVFGTMTLVGLLLLINRFVPLALTLIAPILVGILTFHLTMQPAGIGPGAFLSLLELYLVWAYRDAFRAMLRARVSHGIK